jgi:uncharacterized protein YjbI with pentapeptide repeats
MAELINLIRKLRSPENRQVLEAIEELRVRGHLSDGSLKNLRLCHVHMQNADLLGADLQKTDFHQAHLEWTDLSRADLCGAKLTRVNLQGANLSQANLDGADLFKANMQDARNLTDEQLRSAKRLCYATMPDGSLYDGRYSLEGDLDFARWGRVNVDDPAEMAYFLGVSLEAFLKGQKVLIGEG